MTPSVGSGYNTASLSCPPSMVMIGAMARNITPLSIDCSAYGADGRRAGATVTVSFPTRDDPLNATVAVTWNVMHPANTVSCPGDQAVTTFRTHVDQSFVDYIEVLCAGIGVNGGRTQPTKAGSFPSTSSLTPTGVLACPVPKFSRGYTTGANGIALVCIDAPLVATGVSSIALSDFHTVGGTAVHGTVTLNGLAASSMTVGLSVTNAPGVVVPALIDVLAGRREATFQIQSAPSAAGCAMVEATLNRFLVSAPLIITPQPPAGAPFSFVLDPEPASRVFAAPSTITAAIVLPSSKLTAPLGTAKSVAPTVTFESDRPNVLAIQSSTQRVVGDSIKVNMSALTNGCAVVTATVNGVIWRKTLRLAAGF